MVEKMDPKLCERRKSQKFFFPVIVIIIQLLLCLATAAGATEFEAEDKSFEQEGNMDYGTLMDQRKLVRKEQKLIEALVNYTKDIKDTISSVKKFVSSYTATTLEPLQSSCVLQLGISKEMKFLDSEMYAENLAKDPFQVFKILNRFSHDLPILQSQLNAHKEAEEKLRKFLKNAKNEYNFPSDEDLFSAQTSVAFLMMLYELKLDDLSEGKILGGKFNASGLTAQDFYEFAEFVGEREIFSFAINLLDKAKTVIETEAKHKHSRSSLKRFGERNLLKLIDTLMKTMIQKHNQQFHLSTNTDQQLKPSAFLFPEEIVELKGTYNDRNITNFRQLSLQEEEFDLEEAAFTIFPDLCRGENTGSRMAFKQRGKPQVSIPPKCYLQINHPVWILSPIKAEVLSKDPLIVQYHDVVSDDEIERIKRHMASRMKRSRVVSSEGVNEIDDFRLSSTATADPSDLIQRWDKKVELITGLLTSKFTDAEILQFTNYATGGHFLPHLDAFFHNSIVKDYLATDEVVLGDRIATFMFYLSPVESGGRTAFPKLGISAEPLKGSALFWYNLHPDGAVDDRLLHGGCPILFGTKWIATKWMRSHNQMFAQKCSPNERIHDDKNYWFYNSYSFEDPL